jgi:hypothetical protein
VRGLSVDGSVELYMGLQPKNAIESILGSLIVNVSVVGQPTTNVSNATNDCLSQAARVSPTEIQHRDVNLRHALKGATVVTQLVDTLEAFAAIIQGMSASGTSRSNRADRRSLVRFNRVDETRSPIPTLRPTTSTRPPKNSGCRPFGVVCSKCPEPTRAIRDQCS